MVDDQVSLSEVPLWKLDAIDLLRAFREGRVTPVDALQAALARMEAVQPVLNACCLKNDKAMRDARASTERWRQGQGLGALDGVPVIIKDNLAVQGMPASWGNAEYSRRMIFRDELPVAALRKAGAIFVGKANTPEFAVEGYTGNALYGNTCNPFDPSLTPGGSSGGVAAAVASGMATLGLGTDGGGSIRRPAAYCALVGLKPGIGHVPRAYGLPQVLLDFEVVGPMTRSVRDARLVDSIIKGNCRSDPASRAQVLSEVRKPLRILHVPCLYGEPCDTRILESTRRFAVWLERQGHLVVDGSLPLALQDMMSQWSDVAEIGLATLFDSDPAVCASASEKYQLMAARGRAARASTLWGILERVRKLRADASRLFAHWDVIVTPSCAAMPWPAADAYPESIDGKAVGPRGHALYSGWVNAIGHPAVSVPVHPSAEGLPIGVQLIGDLGSESTLLDLAEIHEWAHGGYRWPAGLTH